jgi:hypothetical protein
MGQHFSVERNPEDGVLRGSNNNWWLYYLYALERVGRMSGQRFFVSTRRGANGDAVPDPHDWYREGCEVLLETQDKFTHRWTGQGSVENDPTIATSLALLFLSKGRRPVVIGKLQHQPQGGGAARDWDHHRRAVQHLTMRVERQWQRDLSWQTIDFTRRGAREGGVRREQLSVTTADLLEAPVLFLSGSQALDFNADQQRLKEPSNGGFVRRACDGNGRDRTAFDRSFRQQLELFPIVSAAAADHPVCARKRSSQASAGKIPSSGCGGSTPLPHERRHAHKSIVVRAVHPYRETTMPRQSGGNRGVADRRQRTGLCAVRTEGKTDRPRSRSAIPAAACAAVSSPSSTTLGGDDPPPRSTTCSPLWRSNSDGSITQAAAR